MPGGGGPGAPAELGAVAAKAIEPTEGHASHAAELSIAFAAGFDRERLTARIVMAEAIISTVPRMSPARRLVTCLLFILPAVCDPYLEH